MIILVANLGSTSFKYKLFEMRPAEAALPAVERVLAVGAADRIGLESSDWYVEVGDQVQQGSAPLKDHAAAIELHLKQLVDGGTIQHIDLVQAIGFKAVHGGPISGAVRVDDKVLATMEQFSDVAPLHNPPYIAAMKAFRAKLPGVPQVAAFETAFHQSIPRARQVYGIPYEWTSETDEGGLGIRRYGFHGASHRYIATRMAELVPTAKRIISCHLGGSCSLCAIDAGRSVGNSFGMTVQTGVFHGARAGDFDAFAILKLLKAGVTLDTVWQRLGKESGLKGLSGVSSDMREVEDAAVKGNKRARLAIEAFVESIRHYLGSYLVALNGADAVVFTGGIGQHGWRIRDLVCDRLDNLGIRLDRERNQNALGTQETRIDVGVAAAHLPQATQVWVLPTNEELIVARQTLEVLTRA